jgi:uncharacterized protein YndB with AHSA1/START domain
MRVELTLEIACSLEQVWQRFDDAAQLTRWQPSLIRVEPLDGTPGQEGARARLTYRESGHDIALIATVEERRAPTLYRCRYESALMESWIDNRFTSEAPDVTIWRVVQTTRFRGLMRLLGPLTRPITVRKFREDMARFKALAEQELASRASSVGVP